MHGFNHAFSDLLASGVDPGPPASKRNAGSLIDFGSNRGPQF